MRDAVGDLVDIMKAYWSKRKLSQVVTSTLFRRRQEEAEAVIEAAISRLHVRPSVVAYRLPNQTLITVEASYFARSLDICRGFNVVNPPRCTGWKLGRMTAVVRVRPSPSDRWCFAIR